MMYRESCDRSASKKLLPVLFSFTLLLSAPWAPAQDGSRPLPKLSVDEKPLPGDLKKATSFAPVIKKVSPSVVNIYTTTTVKDSASRHPLFNDPLFRRFFGGNGGSERSRPRTEQSLGSGVIVSTDGYILTACHVVAGADRVKVSLSTSDQEYDAKVVGTDPSTDVAVLKLDMDKALPAVTLGDSEKLEVGDLVLALGNPFGVGQTVTMGIISAVGRGDFGIARYENFIQTDAAVNVGNSGGALVDAGGRLVGINTAIVSDGGGFMGVSIAVPINMARFVMERLVTEGKVNRGYLGIRDIQSLSPGLAKAFGLPNESGGVIVGGVERGSGAEKAGLKAGDLIVELNGKKVADTRNLQLLVAQTAPGANATVRILRGQRGEKPVEKVLTVPLGLLPQSAYVRGRGPDPANEDAANDALEGVEVADLDGRTRRRLQVPDNIKGVLVMNVDPHSNSAAAGLRPGDVLMQIDQKPVQTATDAVELSEKADGETIKLRIWSQTAGRAGATRDILVENKKQE